MTRILATGDWHIGAHPEYGRAPGDRLRDQERVFDLIADLAVEHHVDAVLHAGDVFDGPTVTPEHLRAFCRPLARLRDVGIPVVALSGNGRHDQAMREVNALAIFSEIGGITVASTPRLVEVGTVTFACLPWVSPARLVAAENGETDRDRVNQRAAELLVATARGLRAVINDDRSAVLALHGSVSGATTPDGALTDLFREPVLDALDLEALGFDAIVCGHIHRPQDLALHFGGPFFYVGSPLPLNFGEASCEHGVYILDVGNPGDHFARSEFVPIESPPFVTLDYDWTEALDERDPVGEDLETEKVVDGAIVRVRYRATAEQARSVDGSQLRAALLDAGAAVVKVEPDIVRVDRARVDGVTEELPLLDAFDLWLDANGHTGTPRESLRDRGSRYLEAAAS